MSVHVLFMLMSPNTKKKKKNPFVCLSVCLAGWLYVRTRIMAVGTITL